MMEQLERVRQRLWTYKQPIAHTPTRSATPISDLFAWRNSEEWETSFELVNIPALLDAEIHGQPTVRHQVEFIFFNQEGQTIKRHELTVENGKRNTIHLKDFLDASNGEWGTFAVFHLHHPKSISELGCFVAERGYVSYRYQHAPLRSYVHGNLDAIAMLAKDKFELLGATSFRKREFRLQFMNQGVNRIELFLVNPTKSTQRLECIFLSRVDRHLLGFVKETIPPGGVRCVSWNLDSNGPAYVEIKSKMVMARPLVFTYQNRTMDVFHG